MMADFADHPDRTEHHVLKFKIDGQWKSEVAIENDLKSQIHQRGVAQGLKPLIPCSSFYQRE